MANADDRRQIANLLIGTIGVLLTITGWLVADKAKQLDSRLERIQAQVDSLHNRITVFENRFVKATGGK